MIFERKNRGTSLLGNLGCLVLLGIVLLIVWFFIKSLFKLAMLVAVVIVILWIGNEIIGATLGKGGKNNGDS